MRRPHVILVVPLIALFAGCSSPEPESPEAPAATVESSFFASEKEAVAAAEEVLTEYWTAANEVLQASGEGVDRLEPHVTAEMLEDARSTASTFRNAGIRQVGEIAFDGTRFQQSFPRGDAEVLIVVTCIDYSNHSVVDAEGQPVPLADLPVRTLFEATLEARAGEADTSLRLAGIEPWPDKSC